MRRRGPRVRASKLSPQAETPLVHLKQRRPAVFVTKDSRIEGGVLGRGYQLLSASKKMSLARSGQNLQVDPVSMD